MTDSEAILSTETSQKVMQLCKRGYESFDKGDAKTALRLFYNAWTVLPKPQAQWREAGWVLTALGDVYFAKGDYQQGQEALLSALHCPQARGNPVIHMRLGMCLFELGELEAARSEFKLVVQNGGEDLFSREDNKYHELVLDHTTE